MSLYRDLQEVVSLIRDERMPLNNFVEVMLASSFSDEEVLNVMTECLKRQEWTLMQAFVLYIYRKPSLIFSGILSEMLDVGSKFMTNEDVVDVLGIIRDVRSIPALERTARTESDSDTFRQLNVKSIQAIHSIGGLEAEQAINRIYAETKFSEVIDEIDEIKSNNVN